MLIVTNLKNNSRDLESLIFNYLQHHYQSGATEEEIKEVQRIVDYLNKINKDVEALKSLYENKLTLLKMDTIKT